MPIYSPTFRLHTIGVYLLLVAVLMPTLAKAQGCSDAGFCTITGSHGQSIDSLHNRLEIGNVYAVAEEDVQVNTQYITYRRQFGARWAASVKTTFSTAWGNFGTRGHFGDVYGTGFYTLSHPSVPKKVMWNALLGVKVPTNLGNLKINQNPLPIVYQSSLGTVDAIAGLNATIESWTLDAAVQLPVVQSNRNSFFAEQSGTDVFPSTNLFERRPDALLRVTYNYQTDDRRLTVRPNLLAIYHLGEDTFEDALGKRQDIKGSDGLTLNINLIADYFWVPRHGLELSVAGPLVVREERPDGLTRGLTAGLAYIARF
ncbi:MAG: hypothetical protein ACK5QE_07385 [Sphingobacteriia bacterium]